MILPVFKKMLFGSFLENRPELEQSEIAIVIGHHAMSKGAYSKFLKTSEYDFNKDVVKSLTSNVDVYTHSSSILGYKSRVKATARRINKKNYKLVILLHFNASAPSANGCEVGYYFKNSKGKSLAQKLATITRKKTGVKIRRDNGAMALLPHNRGYWSVYFPKATTILYEPFFGSNEKDCYKVNAHRISEILDGFLTLQDVARF